MSEETWEERHRWLQGAYIDALALYQAARLTANEDLVVRTGAGLEAARGALVAHIGAYGDAGMN